MVLRRRREKKTARFHDLETWQAESRSRSGKWERIDSSMSPSMETSSPPFSIFWNDFWIMQKCKGGKSLYIETRIKIHGILIKAM